MRSALVLQMVGALVILSGCDSEATFVRAHVAEAKHALLTLAARQERFYLQNNTYSNDMTQLGFPADPAVLESGTYTVDILPGADDVNYIATADYNGVDVEKQECQWIRIDGRGDKTSGPRIDCWKR